MLLERGKADIEETTPFGNTALNIAAEEGHASTVALLLSKGARMDTRRAVLYYRSWWDWSGIGVRLEWDGSQRGHFFDSLLFLYQK